MVALGIYSIGNPTYTDVEREEFILRLEDAIKWLRAMKDKPRPMTEEELAMIEADKPVVTVQKRFTLSDE